MTRKQIALLRKVKDQILAHPTKYDQGEWCGTACCIAGHLAVAAGAVPVRRTGYDGSKFFTGDVKFEGETVGAATLASRLIGESKEYPWLFAADLQNGDTNPPVGAPELNEDDSPAVKAAKGALAIEMYIQQRTGGE